MFHAYLKGVPFLLKGTFNGKFKVDDRVLDDIVGEFQNGTREEPQIFIGHEKKEEFLTNGIITKIYKSKYKGQDALFYDAEIDEPLYNLLKEKKLTKCSGEFYLSNIDEVSNSKASPKWYLGGMAILGRSSPAVPIASIKDENIVLAKVKENLASIFFPSDARLSSGVLLENESSFNFSFDFSPAKFLENKTINKKEGGNKMTQEQIDSMFSENLSNVFSKISELIKRVECLENKDKESESIKESLSELQKENLALKDNLAKFSLNMESIDLFNKRLGMLTSKVTSSEDSVITTEEELSREVLKYAKDNDLTYTKALSEFKETNKNRIQMEV